MEERKHIDRLFQEKFKDFEGHPHERVWESIHSQLQNKRNQRSWIHSAWSRAAGVAAAIAIFFLIGDWFSRSTSPEVATQKNEQQDQREPQIIPTPDSALAEVDEAQQPEASSDIKYTEAAPAPAKRPRLEVVYQNSSLKTNGINPSRNLAAIFLSQEPVRDLDQTEPQELEIAGISIFDAMETTPKSQQEVQQLGKGKLVVTTQAAPLFYGNMSKGNFLSSSFNNNPSETEVTFAYGVNLSYAISDRIKVRSGINKVNMSYNTLDVPYRAAMDPSAMASVSFNPEIKARATAMAAAGPAQYMSTNAVKRSVGSLNQTSLNQKLGYIEIPVELQYNLLNKRIEINIIGGGSTLFLDENVVSMQRGQDHTNIGKANNLNTVSFSTNIGLGVDYRLTEKFKLNLEPMFKYQLNTFSSDTQNYQPYFMGVYSGFSFEF